METKNLDCPTSPCYPKESAGHRMTVFVPIAREGQTIGQIHDLLASNAKDFKSINYVYVVDADSKLIGVLSIRDLFVKMREAKVGDVCKRSPLVSIHPESHQERAAYLALRHNIKAIPVVDKNHVFLGEITADSILSILHKEMHEDSLKRAGIRHPDALHGTVLTLSLFSSFRHRIPWLLLGLIGGLLAAKIIGFFEATLEENLVLAAFLPLIVYMSSAVGLQMQTYIIRDLATEQTIRIQPYLMRNVFVVVSIATVLSLLLLGAFGFFFSDWHMGFVLALSLFASVCSSLCTGLLIPFLFSKLSLDPADASGPIATILQDMMSIVIYLGIASAML